MEDKLNNIDIISGFKYAGIADVVFSGVFLRSQIDTLNLAKNIEEYVDDNEYIFVRKKSFTLRENDVVFCKTEFVSELFSILKKQCNLKNIKLITHQSDVKISQSLYNTKPDCISTWYSINVDVEKSDLIPIPIGIANFHTKNLNEKDLLKTSNSRNYFINKSKLLYVNFNQNTNFSHRKGLYDYFRSKSWSESDIKPLDHVSYREKLSEHKFVLSPWGNGIDTHRFWESLYSGSIPITKEHKIYDSFRSIPKVLVSSYRNISETFLNQEFEKLLKNNKDYSFEELNFSYWERKICDTKNDIDSNSYIDLYNYRYRYFGLLAEFKHRLKSKLKILNRIRRFIYKRFNI